MRKKKLCISVRRERKTEQPPRLFDLTGLQREGNRIYGYTAKQMCLRMLSQRTA